MKKLFVVVIGMLLLVAGLIGGCGPSEQVAASNISSDDSLQNISKLFGFNLAEYNVNYDTIKSGWTWNNLLAKFNIDQYTINQTAKKAKDSLIGLSYICAGKPFELFTPKKSKSGTPTHLVYELSPLTYITFNFLKDSVSITRKNRPISITEKTISGIIEKNSNLSEALNKTTNSYSMTNELTAAIEGIYAWSVDFFRLQVGDKFVINYTEKSIDGKPYSIDKINYAWFENAGEGMYAFHFSDTAAHVSGFYNEKAQALVRPFLKAPVKYSRISSYYSSARFHPILKRVRAHLGTDYAAPMGTPIHNTADGVVERAAYTSGNGNYVKIRHNSTYETQYLHMHKIADGIHPGVHVKQGQVIGFVGMTGLATGPHVCYRFWKNGKQVDPRKQKFPNSKPMKKEVQPEYFKFIQPLKEKLDKAIHQIKIVEANASIS